MKTNKFLSFPKSVVWVKKKKHDGRRPLGRPRVRWKENIKMDLQQVEWGMNWIDLTQDRER
jgi:hypothetical protein